MNKQQCFIVGSLAQSNNIELHMNKNQSSRPNQIQPANPLWLLYKYLRQSMHSSLWPQHKTPTDDILLADDANNTENVKKD